MDRELAREKRERDVERATWNESFDHVYGWLTRAAAERNDALARLAAAEHERDRAIEQRAAAEHQRDKAAAALEESEKILAAATRAGQQILDRLHGLEAAILDYGRWVRASFPPELEQSDAEQHLLDLADALVAPPATEGGVER